MQAFNTLASEARAVTRQPRFFGRYDVPSNKRARMQQSCWEAIPSWEGMFSPVVSIPALPFGKIGRDRALDGLEDSISTDIVTGEPHPKKTFSTTKSANAMFIPMKIQRKMLLPFFPLFSVL
jgi:hypothetical protein